MTKRGYELIAAAIKRAVDASRAGIEGKPIDALQDLAEDLAGELLARNAKFDPKRFLAACGLS